MIYYPLSGGMVKIAELDDEKMDVEPKSKRSKQDSEYILTSL